MMSRIGTREWHVPRVRPSRFQGATWHSGPIMWDSSRRRCSLAARVEATLRGSRRHFRSSGPGSSLSTSASEGAHMIRKSSYLMRALVIGGALTFVAGCDLSKILDVQPANLIPSGEVENPANAALLVTGAAADFDCAFNSYVAVGALITGEFVDALQTADRWPYNQRTVAPNQVRYS